MPKLQLNATELVEPDVDLVAMVKRGANRIPFRLTKKDGADMIDLSKIGAALFSKSATPKTPTVVGVIFAKGADIEALTATLKASGIDVSEGFTKAEGAQATTFTKADTEADPENLLVLKLDDQVAVTITGPQDLIKRVSGYDWESTSFSEVLTKGTFAPSLCMAQDMLQTTFWNIMEKADDRAELGTLLKTAVTEFSSYVDSLVAAVPDSIFKADEALAKGMGKDKKMKGKDKGLADAMDEDDKMEKKDDKDPCQKGYVQVGMKELDGKMVPNCVPEADAVKKADGTYMLKSEAFLAPDGTYMSKEEISGNPTHGNETDTSKPGSTTSNDIENNPAAGNETAKNPPTKNKGPGGATSNNIEGKPAADDAKTSQPAMKTEGLDEMLTLLKTMQEGMTNGLADLRKHVDQSVATVKDEVSGLTKKVAKAEAALGGTVVGDAAGDQTGALTKSETTPSAPPLLDTAFMKLEQPKKAA
ncbi:hypothetical protein RCZAHN_18 [Rhodobacter phage RcZahn]|nr:hypothetical protein RCZAHN_18 [Rhodobacter phage RcZahn]